MKKKANLNRHRWHGTVLCLAAGLTLVGAAAAQDNTAPAPPKKVNVAQPLGYSTLDLEFFAGEQGFQFGQGTTHSVKLFDPSVVWGERLTWDFSRYIGLEGNLQNGYNRIKLTPFGATGYANFSGKNTEAWADVIVHLTPRDSRIRPFIFAGPGYTWYFPGDITKIKTGSSTLAPVGPTPPLKTIGRPALMYGIGMKVNMSPRWGVRFDIGGMRSGTPHFDIPGLPGGPGTLYIPAGGHESALTASMGVVLRLRYHPPPPPPPPPAPVVEAPKPQADIRIAGITGAKDVCAGENLRLQVNASGWLPDQTPSYQWMVNGTPVEGATADSFSVPTADSPGAKTITVKVSAGESSKTSDPVTVNVAAATPPTIQFAISPSTIPYGTKVNLAANATGSQCGGNPTVTYSGEGVSGNTFDSSALNFDQSNRLKQQTRTVHITATATDPKNQTATAGADVTVTLTAQARRLDDMVFPVNSSRVNNCAKRLLLEELTPMLRSDPDAKVILIGHRDSTERARGAVTVDEARVLNSAAVLSAGKGICPSLDLSRIKVNWVGTEQGSETRPALCGSSTNVKEKGGQSVRESDKRAQYRRVEVGSSPGAPICRLVSAV